MDDGSSMIVRYRYLILIISAIIMMAGYVQLRDKSIDLLPEFAPPIVEVQTEALGLSAEEVESLITVPMEADLLNGISWIKTIRSQSMPGLSSILMVFEDGTDILNARQLVQERLTQAHALPNVSRPPVMLQPLSSTSRVMQVGLSSSELSNIEISVQAHWVMRPRLMGVPGVANVSIWGQRNRQLQVLVDPNRLISENITLKQIVSTTGNSLWFSPLSYLNASTPGSGGFIDTPNQRLSVRHVLPISTPDELANVAIEGTQRRLGDVTTIIEDHQPLIGDAVVGDGPGVLLVIEKFPWADTVTVTEGIDAALADLRPSLPGVEMDATIFRRANFVQTASENLLQAALIGAALLFVALLVFTRNWRAVLVAAISISASLAAAVTVLLYAGVGFDIIMMSGLTAAIGVVVNDATVDIGMLKRGWRDGDPPLSAFIAQVHKQTRGALGFATLIAILAILPMYAMGGVPGAVSISIALPFATAVIASLVVSVTLTPALSWILMSGDRVAGQANPAATARGHLAMLQTARGPVFGLACALAFVGVALAAFSQLSVVPTFKERDIIVDWSAAPGTSHPAMARVASKVVSELRELPGIRSVGAHIGRAITSDRISNVNTAQIWANLNSGADYDQTLAAIHEVVDGYPGASREVLNYTEEKTRQFGGEASNSLTVRVFGYDLEVLETLAEEVRGAVSAIGGLKDVKIQEQVLEPVVKIEADLEKSKKFGIKPGDVRRTSAVLLSGLEVGSLFENQKVFEVVVWGVPEIRDSVTGISDIVIDSPDGGLVRLGDVANVSVGALPSIIRRDAVSRYVDVTATVSDGDINTIAARINDQIAQMKFPLEYHAELLSDYAETQAAKSQLILALLAAAIGGFLLIQAAVGGWRLGAATFVALLAALSGGTIVVAATGGVLSLGAIAGLLATLGVASRGALVLIHHYQSLERAGGSFGLDLVAQGTRDRLDAIIAVGFGAALAVAPAAALSSMPGLETLGPLAMVLIGGLITTTLVNLYVVPALYLLFGAGTARAGSDLLVEEGQYNAA